MRLRRKLVLLLTAISLSVAFAPAVSAAPFSNCVAIASNYHPNWHVFRNTSTYYAAQGEVVIRQLRACTNSNGTPQQSCAAQVWPANMQGSNEFKQIGFASVGSITDPPTCNSSAMNWWATVNGGIGNVDNVSQMSLAFYPAIGDTIRFSIYRYAPGGFVYWRLKVDDLSHAGWYGWREIIQNASSVPEVWYGIENHSKQTQFGSTSATNQVRLRGLSYRLSNGGAWNYLEGNGSAGMANTQGLGYPSCWINSVSTYSGPISPIQTSLNGYTTC